MTTATSIKVEGQRQGKGWVLVSERTPPTEAAQRDLASRGWRSFGMVRRTNGKTIYLALVAADGSMASIVGR
jgi:hypothetical protein